MIKNYQLICFLIFLLLIVILLSFVNSSKNLREVCFKSNCFQVEIANNEQERSKGLMYREKLDENSGMLFIFEEEGVYPFWMKNTLIHLDIIWINKNKEVVYIMDDAQPCMIETCESFNPGKDALYVLEINSGKSEELGIKIGNRLEFK